MFSPKSVGVGWSLEDRVVKRSVGVLHVAWPNILPITVDGGLMCVTRPHKLLWVKDYGPVFELGSPWNGVKDGLFGGLEP